MNKKTILLADDDPGILEAVTLMLEDAGYTVKSTTDGRTVQEVNEELPDLILLDIWMSGMDGREICQRLKSQELTRHIPLIMLSANKDTKHIAREAGADDYIAKPFEMHDLLATVERHLREGEVKAG